jgi:biopolymer transport protein ExbB
MESQHIDLQGLIDRSKIEQGTGEQAYTLPAGAFLHVMHTVIHNWCGKWKNPPGMEPGSPDRARLPWHSHATPGLLIGGHADTVRAFPAPGRAATPVFAIIEAAGWPIWPLIACSIVAVAIIGERLWTLRTTLVTPPDLLARTLNEYRQHGATPDLIARLAADSPLGQVLAAGLRNAERSREIMREAIEETGRGVSHQLGRFLTSLGTIAAMSPLLGLFGTVIGMIEIFGAQGPTGTPEQLAHGISIALYNTAFGLIIAIPSIIFYRYFRARVDGMLVDMELAAVKLVEIVHGERQP